MRGAEVDLSQLEDVLRLLRELRELGIEDAKYNLASPWIRIAFPGEGEARARVGGDL